MKKSVLMFSLLSGTALMFPRLTIASGFPAHTHTYTPEPKPAFQFEQPDKAYKTAGICFLGVGDCDPNVGFGKGDDGNYSVDTIEQCKNEGFSKQNCGLLEEVDGACPYNPGYGLGCRCKTSLVSCSSVQDGVGDSCDGKYASCTCKPSLVSCNSAEDGIGESCGGKYQSCVCKSNLVSCNEAQDGIGDSCDGKFASCKCKTSLVSCTDLQEGTGYACDGKYVSCSCKPDLIECNSAQDGVGNSCDGKYKECTCKNSLISCGSNQEGVGESCGGKYVSCQCDSSRSWYVCSNGGETGALSCSLNGTTYWTECKPDRTNEEICMQKLAEHSSALGYTIYQSGKSQSMGKGYIIVGNQTASSLPGTKIFGAPYFSQIPECVLSSAKLTLNPSVTNSSAIISTVSSLQLENVEIELDPVNKTGSSSLYVTGILIDPGSGTSMNNKLKDVVFSSKLKDYNYYYLKMGNPVTSCPSTGGCTTRGNNNTALYIYGKVEMKGVGYSMLTPASGPVYINNGAILELDGAQFSGGNGGQIRINNGNMKIRYLSIGAENTKLANGSTESILIVENYGTLYATEKLLIDSQGTTRLEIRDGGKVYTPQVGLRLNPEILIKGNYAGLFIWDPATNEQTAVKTTNSSSAQCLLDYSGGGSSVYYGKSKISELARQFKCN